MNEEDIIDDISQKEAVIIFGIVACALFVVAIFIWGLFL